MKSLLSSKPGKARETRRTERMDIALDGTNLDGTTLDGVRQTPAAAAPGPLASFARFVLCGGGVGFASSAAVTLLATLLPWVVANALITVASTLLCTELHARFTFGAGGRAGWRRHLQSAGSASAAYAVTCAAMLVLHVVQPSAGVLCEQIVYLSASALAGLGRFLVLRLFVFAVGRNAVGRNAVGRNGTTARAKSPAPVQNTVLTVQSALPVPVPVPVQPVSGTADGHSSHRPNNAASPRAIRCTAREASVASRSPRPMGSATCLSGTKRQSNSPTHGRQRAVSGLALCRAAGSRRPQPAAGPHQWKSPVRECAEPPAYSDS
jgi:putative flippase GtrA